MRILLVVAAILAGALAWLLSEGPDVSGGVRGLWDDGASVAEESIVLIEGGDRDVRSPSGQPAPLVEALRTEVPVSASALIAELGLTEDSIREVRMAPYWQEGDFLEPLRTALVGKNPSRAALLEGIRDPAATPQQKTLLLLATIWSEDDVEGSFLEALEPVDRGVLAGGGSWDDPELKYEYAKFVTLGRLRIPGSGDFLLSGFDPVDAVSMASEITTQGHLIKHALAVSTEQDPQARDLAQSIVAHDVEGMGVAPSAWSALAQHDLASVVSKALSFETGARGGLMLAARSAGPEESAKYLPLPSVDAVDVRTGHYADQGTRAVLAASDAEAVPMLFQAMDTASPLKKQWMHQGITSAESCPAIGEFLRRSTGPAEVVAGLVTRKDVLALAERVEERLRGGDMSPVEERRTLASVAGVVRTFPPGSPQREIALRMLRVSMDAGHRALAAELTE